MQIKSTRVIELFKAKRKYRLIDRNEIYKVQTNANCFIFIKRFPR